MKKIITLILFGAVGAANAALVQWFKLDEGATDPTTNTTYSTSSVNIGWFTNNGGVVFPVWTNDTPSVPSGSLAAVYLDGTASPRPSVNTDYPGYGAAGTVTGAVARTVCAWIKASTNQPATAGAHIVSWGGTASGGVTGGRYTFKLQPNGTGADFGKLRLEVQGGGINGTKNLADGKWHHVTVVSTNGSTVGNAKLYVDGAPEPITTSSGTGTPINTVVTTTGIDWVHIGGGSWDLARGFNGAIDDVRIYDTALALTDIQTIVFGGTTPAGAQPLARQTIVLGDTNATATFTVSASGTPPLGYQWFFNGGPVANQTDSSLTVSPAGPANVGLYSVTVSNMFGVTNVSASLALVAGPVDPPMQVALVGASASINVTMPSTSTGYTYQWTRNGTAVPGATASAYTAGSATLADDSTNYGVVVSLSGISVTSAPVALHVVPVSSSTYANLILQDGPAAYWRLGETNGAAVAVDQTGFHNGAYLGYTGVELGVAGAVTNDADTASSFSSTTRNYIEVPYSSELGRTNAYTLEAWVFPTGGSGRQTILSSYGGVPNAGFELAMDAAGQWVFRTSHSTNSTGLFWDDLTGGPANMNEWTHLVATYDGAVKSLYVNGAAAGTQTFNLFAALGINIRLGAGGTAPAEAATVFNGTLDEVAIYRKALGPSQVMAHYQAGVGAPNLAPVPLSIAQAGTVVTLSWPGSWVLQKKALLDNNPATWSDVTNVSPFVVPGPLPGQQFFRLRSP
jgi:hypothetical protein